MSRTATMGYEQFINYLAVDYFESRGITPTQHEIDEMEQHIIHTAIQTNQASLQMPMVTLH
jgi:hypothetical protein